MAKNLFSVPIFFIVFRETLEAVIIIAVLLGLVEQLVQATDDTTPAPTTLVDSPEKEKEEEGTPGTPNQAGGDVPVLDNGAAEPEASERALMNKRLLRRMRIQVSFLLVAEPSLVN
jgi:high-affinity iron transporter